ncbi:hypothetical protein, partial [Bacillus tropicus]|uniref:hypothetical protein n=1 Tax=Bacillus tropicus TaxID=2026188 RepID=UPI003D212285
MTATDEMVRYWNELYCSCPNGERIVEELLGPLKKIQLRRGDFDTAYDSVMSAIGDQDIYFPEAYFGFLNSDIREDVLGLFMNPGAVKHATESWNNEVIRQYTEWEPANYLGECGALTETSPVSKNKKCSCYLNTRHKSGCRWRKERYDELRTNFGLNDFRFLH